MYRRIMLACSIWLAWSVPSSAKYRSAVDIEAVTAHRKELPPREQRILLLRFYGNLTRAEIGERLGISQMHVSRLLARALAHLRWCLPGRGRARHGRAPGYRPVTGNGFIHTRGFLTSRRGATMKTATGRALLAIGATLTFPSPRTPRSLTCTSRAS
jgi:predicted DNA-binding protein (UPF0251 family)